MDFTVPTDHRVDHARELEKKQEVTEIPIVIAALGTILKGLIKGIRRVENRMTSRDHLNGGITMIVLNTGESPGDLMRLVVTHTPVKDYLLVLV